MCCIHLAHVQLCSEFNALDKLDKFKISSTHLEALLFPLLRSAKQAESAKREGVLFQNPRDRPGTREVYQALGINCPRALDLFDED